MRLILTILLIGLFKADAQMVINASQPYRVLQQDLLLDKYPIAEGAYSLRKLINNYTGNCIRIRRDSTGQTETDIGFDINGIVDTNAIKSFVRNNSAFIVNWYDQSGNARTANQGTAGNQPRIALNGVINRINNNPSIIFDGSDDFLICNAVSTSISGEDKPFSIITVLRKNNTNSLGIPFGFGRSTTDIPLLTFRFAATNNDVGFQLRDNANVSSLFEGGTYQANTQYLASIYSSGLNFEIFLNNTSQLNNTYNRGATTLNLATIGALNRFGSTAGYWGGHIQEVIVYAADKKSDRTGLETQINNFYSIY